MKIDKSQLRISSSFLMGLFIVFVVIQLLLPSLASTGKPTPKQGAYRRCLDYAKFVNYAATNNQFALDISKLADENISSTYHSSVFTHLLFSAQDLAKQGEDFLIKTNCSTAKTNHEIVVVCEKSFDYDKANASFWNLFKRNYAHAVGYSDGSADIISPTEFSNLDLRGFASLLQIATNALEADLGK
jgi:hypothetical protein